MCENCKQYEKNFDYKFCPRCGRELIRKPEISASQVIQYLRKSIDVENGYCDSMPDKLFIEIEGQLFSLTAEKIYTAYDNIYDYLKYVSDN